MLVACTLDCTLSPWRTHNHDAKQNQQRCEKETRTSATSGGETSTQVGATFARRSCRSQAEQTSHTRRNFGVALLLTMTMVHTGTLQTAIHVRIASIIACRHTRFSTRHLRHRFHTGWPNTRTLPQACMQEPLKNASDNKHNQQQKRRRSTKRFHDHAIR